MMTKRKRLFVFGLSLYGPSLLGANSTGNLLDPYQVMIVLAVIALAPVLMVLTTSFAKIVIVFSILRQALGTPQAPPNLVLTSFSIILTAFCMYPVYKAIEKEWSLKQLPTTLELKDITAVFQVAEKPLKEFMLASCRKEDRQMFLDVHEKMTKEALNETDWVILSPAFLLSQISQAFKIGFLIYLPFVVVDMAIANLLMALGMQMLAPTTISLPFKILLFILMDGFSLIAKGLIS